MAMLFRKDKGAPCLTRIARLSVVGLIVALSAALINTIWAVYLDSFLHSEVYVGLLSACFTILAFISYFVFIPVVEKRDKAKIFFYSLLSLIVFFLLFSITTNFYLFLILAFALIPFSTLKLTSYGLLIRDASPQKKLSRNEGLVYTSQNIAFVVGPLIAGYVAAQFGVGKIFIIAAVCLLSGALVFKFSKIPGKQGKKKIDYKVVKNFIDFFKNKDRVIAYILGGGISIWWILIYLFIPLRIIRSGLSELWIGYFLFAVAVPLIFLEYIFSNWACKHGFRKIFKLAHLCLAVVALICFFLTDIYAILFMLVLASVPMAMLEPTTEAYFFDILKGKERYRFYGPYNTAIDAGSLTGKLVASAVLILLPFKFVFLAFSMLMFLLYLLSFKTKKVVESKRK
ncbi:MAG: MFS transporter [Nanoarchaeota archaeon]|nr:MFS transporter [Nanoarchaeota archaeon]